MAYFFCINYIYGMHKPWHSLIFGVFLFLALSLLSFTFPKEGLDIGASVQLNFPDMNDLFGHKQAKKDITKILDAISAVDTTFSISDATSDSAFESPVDSMPKLNTEIQYRNNSALEKFFSALRSLNDNPASIRVLHYGDSQIEGDRITDYLRLKLQGQFGGHGPGLQTHSGNQTSERSLASSPVTAGG